MNDTEKLLVMKLLDAIEEMQRPHRFRVQATPNPFPMQAALRESNVRWEAKQLALSSAMAAVRKML